MSLSLRTASVICALALSACSMSNEPTPVPANAQPMNAAEISALFANPVNFDNNITGGMSYEFKPGGQVNFSMRLLPVQKPGQWKQEGDRLCISVDSDPWACGNFYRISANQFYFNLPEYDQDYNTLNLR